MSPTKILNIVNKFDNLFKFFGYIFIVCILMFTLYLLAVNIHYVSVFGVFLFLLYVLVRYMVAYYKKNNPDRRNS